MKRFHVHLHVDDLPASIAFYARLFSIQPTRTETDYAKWILEDPRVNFAISTRGTRAGLDHLGFQTDTEEELCMLRQNAANAQLEMIDEGETSCCYARSEKHWIVDPQGIPWEHFHTLGNIAVFNEQGNARIDGVCCAPVSGRPLGIPVKPGSSCC
jgi:hypothetical protein